MKPPGGGGMNIGGGMKPGGRREGLLGSKGIGGNNIGDDVS